MRIGPRHREALEALAAADRPLTTWQIAKKAGPPDGWLKALEEADLILEFSGKEDPARWVLSSRGIDVTERWAGRSRGR